MDKQISELKQLMSAKSDISNVRTRVIAVTSGKGGVGKTNIATNLATTFASMGKQVVLFDGDLGLSNVNILLKVMPQHNLIDVMRKYLKMHEILTDSGYGFQFVSGIPGFSGLANITQDMIDYFVQEMMRLSFAHVLLIDTGAGVGKTVTSFLSAAHDIIIVTTPEPTSMADAYGMMKVLATDIDTSQTTLHLVVNKVDTFHQGKEVAQRIVQASESILNLNISYLGCIVNDSIISKAVMKQVPFVVHSPKSKPASNIKSLAHTLMNREEEGKSGLLSFLERLKGKNSNS